MPLDKSSKCDGFWKNVKDLAKKFLKDEGGDPQKARKRAIATAARTMKDSGGDPTKCINSEGGQGKDKKGGFGGKKAAPFGKGE